MPIERLADRAQAGPKRIGVRAAAQLARQVDERVARANLPERFEDL